MPYRAPHFLPTGFDNEPFPEPMQLPADVRTLADLSSWVGVGTGGSDAGVDAVVSSNLASINQFVQSMRRQFGLGSVSVVTRMQALNGMHVRYQNQFGRETIFLHVSPTSKSNISAETPEAQGLTQTPFMVCVFTLGSISYITFVTVKNGAMVFHNTQQIPSPTSGAFTDNKGFTTIATNSTPPYNYTFFNNLWQPVTSSLFTGVETLFLQFGAGSMTIAHVDDQIPTFNEDVAGSTYNGVAGTSSTVIVITQYATGVTFTGVPLYNFNDGVPVSDNATGVWVSFSQTFTGNYGSNTIQKTPAGTAQAWTTAVVLPVPAGIGLPVFGQSAPIVLEATIQPPSPIPPIKPYVIVGMSIGDGDMPTNQWSYLCLLDATTGKILQVASLTALKGVVPATPSVIDFTLRIPPKAFPLTQADPALLAAGS